MPLSNEEIKEILAIVDESGWDEARLTVEDVTLVVSKTGSIPLSAAPPSTLPLPPTSAAAPAPTAPALPEAAAPPPPGDGEHLVTAPSVGIFWRAPAPGAAPFVEVGDTVEPEQTVCIVEVMKLMQHVVAGVGGVVAAIHQDNSGSVEYGSPLFTIAPAEAGA
jgi:acetyl-CoA carboxylase biotin carboxyl carrier protein